MVIFITIVRNSFEFLTADICTKFRKFGLSSVLIFEDLKVEIW